MEQGSPQVRITCPKCGSGNVTFQVHQETKTITKTKSKYKEKRHGLLWWLCVGWWWWIFDLLFWVFLFIPRALLHIGRRKQYKGKSKSVAKEKAKYRTVCLCQDCGMNWTR